MTTLRLTTCRYILGFYGCGWWKATEDSESVHRGRLPDPLPTHQQLFIMQVGRAAVQAHWPPGWLASWLGPFTSAASFFGLALADFKSTRLAASAIVCPACAGAAAAVPRAPMTGCRTLDAGCPVTLERPSAALEQHTHHQCGFSFKQEVMNGGSLQGMVFKAMTTQVAWDGGSSNTSAQGTSRAGAARQQQQSSSSMLWWLSWTGICCGAYHGPRPASSSGQLELGRHTGSQVPTATC